MVVGDFMPECRTERSLTAVTLDRLVPILENQYTSPFPLADVDRIKKWIDKRSKVMVIGGGVLGLELAYVLYEMVGAVHPEYRQVGLGGYLVFLLAELPAQHIMGWALADNGKLPFSYANVKGDLWHGKMEAINYQGMPLDKLEWRFTPSGLSRRDFYSVWPIAIHLNGKYHNLGLFFDRIRRFSRIINIEDLRISSRRAGRHTLTARFTLKTFIYNRPREEEG